ncbi:rhamnulokinase [Virgibacillus pantothenticus]|uniref:rhamnulokinase n=1 Tax=Virgibacillus pantothenticus TaxID=1473 RepID=UPI001C222D4A|nr:rhamnulokinase family protein [Virgibacillus pantothenticus]MBU8567027.1 rhamnulokinase [Virgibacillus pantothenticus]MBU8601951.1 rhamnulokinase [Virgibacillus pantothenticus]MBU8635054.1 rhamnulokinase [Virgibacillus pantothenticus]MBU8642883.1 rhamnulokinase [Virgibacillus pantothenticus]MBU8646831.1 rhamnulokinase [Virgibacillus pantothenticus]
MTYKKLLAVDLGASSGRVMQGLFDGKKVELSEVHRFNNNPISVEDNLYWDVLNLFQQIKKGIVKSSRDGIPIESIAVDTWGVDYCYLDKDGDLIFNPRSYRDQRTKRYENDFYKELSKEDLFKKTGVQPNLINSINQIHADLASKPYLRKIVEKVLFMPDFFTYLLSGQMINEYTISSTSGLLDVSSRQFSKQLMEKISIPIDWFSNILKGGKTLGTLRTELCNELNVNEIKVVAGGSHDTASAVLAVPYIKSIQETAFISSGTWSLVGVESTNPVVTNDAFLAGLTNEGTFDGNYRILKNTTGLWIYNELRRDWSIKGENLSHKTLADLAEEIEDNKSYINPNAEPFSKLGNMEEKIQNFCMKTNQEIPKTKRHLVRVILESLAMSYRNTIEQIEDITNRQINQIQMVGGGIQNELLCQLTADFTSREVIAGPIEASSLGNVISQLITLGLINRREDIVTLIKNSEKIKTYKPRKTFCLEDKYNQFSNILI